MQQLVQGLRRPHTAERGGRDRTRASKAPYGRGYYRKIKKR